MIRTLLMIILVSVRGARYIMDLIYDRFEILDLFSLHICHIDLILLAICLVRPRSELFSFVFLLGIPAGLSVALFPGSIHPVPGLPRAMFFIMSHMMLVVGAIYLALTEHLVIRLRHMLTIIIAGIIGLAGIFGVNLILRSNFLYLNEAPPGTIIETLDQAFGWPGYVAALIVLAVLLIFFMYGIWRLLMNRQRKYQSKLSFSPDQMFPDKPL